MADKQQSKLVKYGMKASAIIAIITLGGYFGYDFDAPASSSDLQALDDKVEFYGSIVLANECLALQKQLDYYNGLKAGYISRKEEVPDAIAKSINGILAKKKLYNCP